MPYKIGWYIEGEVIYIQYGCETNAQEVLELLDKSNAYVRQAQRTLVHEIIDLTQMVKPLSLVEIAKTMKSAHPDPHIGWTITVGEQDKLMKFTTSVARQIWGLRQRSYNTLPEALDFLRDIDSGLDWSKANDQIFIHEA